MSANGDQDCHHPPQHSSSLKAKCEWFTFTENHHGGQTLRFHRGNVYTSLPVTFPDIRYCIHNTYRIDTFLPVVCAVTGRNLRSAYVRFCFFLRIFFRAMMMFFPWYKILCYIDLLRYTGKLGVAERASLCQWWSEMEKQEKIWKWGDRVRNVVAIVRINVARK